jgi:mono/diheme cytochrome c family protein
VRLATLALIASLAMSQSPAKVADGNNAKGEQLFLRDGCYECHGNQAQGGGAGPRIGPGPLAFAAFAQYLRQPAGQMPPYTAKVLSDRDLMNIYVFLQSLPQPPSPKSLSTLNN